jgi:hypothetical protein
MKVAYLQQTAEYHSLRRNMEIFTKFLSQLTPLLLMPLHPVVFPAHKKANRKKSEPYQDHLIWSQKDGGEWNAQSDTQPLHREEGCQSQQRQASHRPRHPLEQLCHNHHTKANQKKGEPCWDCSIRSENDDREWNVQNDANVTSAPLVIPNFSPSESSAPSDAPSSSPS